MKPKSPDKPSTTRSKLKRAALFGTLSLALHTSPGAKSAYEFLAPEIRDAIAMKTRDARAFYRSLFEKEDDIDVSKFKGPREYDPNGEMVSPEEYEKRRKAAEDLIIFHPKKARELVLNGTIPLDKMYVDHSRFFIETEYQRGVTAEETVERRAAAAKLMAEINVDLKEPRTAEGEVALIHKYVGRYGQNNTWNTDYMGDLLTSEKKEGNCSARTKLILTILNDGNWKHIKDIKVTVMDIHAEVLFKMSNGKWYTISNFPYEIPEGDISETALIDRNVYIKTHLGIKSDVRVLDENKNPERSRSMEAIIVGLLTVGGMPMLLKENLVGLRSPYDLEGPPKPKPVDPIKDAITVELMDNYQPSNPSEFGTENPRNRTGGRREEEEGYKLSKKERIDARLSGRFAYDHIGVAPLKDLKQLEDIEMTSLYLNNSKVEDLSPIKKHRLKEIVLDDSLVEDLSPLKGMPLEKVVLVRTRVTDLSPLQGAPIRSISIGSGAPMGLAADPIKNRGPADLSPLAGMPLEWVSIDIDDYTIDLGPLQGAPIRNLSLHSPVTNLEAIKGAPIKVLRLSGSNLQNLSAFQGMPIEDLDLTGSKVTDLSAIASMPIRIIRLSDKVRDLSSIKKLLLRLKNEGNIITPPCLKIDWQTFRLAEDKRKNRPEYCDNLEYDE